MALSLCSVQAHQGWPFLPCSGKERGDSRDCSEQGCAMSCMLPTQSACHRSAQLSLLAPNPCAGPKNGSVFHHTDGWGVEPPYIFASRHHSTSRKGHVLPVHIKHTKFTLKHLSLHCVCYCGSKGLPCSSKKQWVRVGSQSPHTGPAAMCSTLLISKLGILRTDRRKCELVYEPRAAQTKSDSLSEQALRTRATKCHLFPWYLLGNTILGEDFMDHISAPSYLLFKLLTVAMENILL